MQEQSAENNDTTEKALLDIKNHIEARDKFRLGFIHRHGKKFFMFSFVNFLALFGYVGLSKSTPFSAFGLPTFWLLLSICTGAFYCAICAIYCAIEVSTEKMATGDLNSYKLEFIDAMKDHPEIKPHMASVTKDIMENTLPTKWYRRMKTLISNLAEAKKTKTSPARLNENQIDNLFLSLVHSEDSKEHVVLRINASPSLEDDRAERNHESKEICWKI